jgi:hypothetical protein
MRCGTIAIGNASEAEGLACAFRVVAGDYGRVCVAEVVSLRNVLFSMHDIITGEIRSTAHLKETMESAHDRITKPEHGARTLGTRAKMDVVAEEVNAQGLLLDWVGLHGN